MATAIRPDIDFAGMRRRFAALSLIDRAYWAAFWLIFTLCAAIFIAPPSPPLQDYSEWVYQAAVMREVVAGGGSEGPFSLAPYPVANSVIQVLMALIGVVAGPLLAGKLVALLYLGLSAWLALRAAGLASAAIAAPAAVVVLSLLLGSTFWSGYLNFNFGLLLVGAYFVILLRGEPDWRLTAAFGVACFFSHATAIVSFGGLVMAHVLWRKAHWRQALALIPAAVLSLWYAVAKPEASTVVEPPAEGLVEMLFYRAYTAAKAGPYHNFFVGETGDLERAAAFYYTGLALNLAFAALAGLLALVFVRDRWGQLLRSPVLAYLAGVATLYIVSPTSFLGVVNIGERFLLHGLLVLVLASLAIRETALIRAAGAVQATLIVSLVSLLAILADIRPTTAPIANDTVVTLDDRGRKFFWKRPFGFWDRVGAAAGVRDGCLDDAPPPRFDTSILVYDPALAGPCPAAAGGAGAR
jgi:hypothetical protein